MKYNYIEDVLKHETNVTSHIGTYFVAKFNGSECAYSLKRENIEHYIAARPKDFTNFVIEPKRGLLLVSDQNTYVFGEGFGGMREMYQGEEWKKDELRIKALAKLSDDEKKALGF